MDSAINKLTGLVNKAKTSKVPSMVTSATKSGLNKIKSNGFVQDVTGMAKKDALNKLNNASSAMSNFSNSDKTFKTLQDNVSQLTDKLQNLEQHLPGNISTKLNHAKNNIDYVKLKNNTLLNKSQEQGMIKNLFDKDVKRAQKELAEAQKRFTELSNQKSRLAQDFAQNLNMNLDKNKADLHKFKQTNKGYQELSSNLMNTQSAYDKALRRTKNARVMTVGTVAGTGLGAYGLNQENKKKKLQQEQQLQYTNPEIGLNNNI